MKIELPEDTEIFEAIRVRVRLTPETDEQPVEFNIAGEFVGVAMLYPFIQMSSVPTTFRRFYIQVSLIVDNVIGPLNPPRMTARQFIDLDISRSYNKSLVVHMHVQVFESRSIHCCGCVGSDSLTNKAYVHHLCLPLFVLSHLYFGLSRL